MLVLLLVDDMEVLVLWVVLIDELVEDRLVEVLRLVDVDCEVVDTEVLVL